MKKAAFFIFVLAIFSIVSCDNSEKHFLKDREYREKVELQFQKRKDLAKNRSISLFSLLDNDSIPNNKKEALKFLYAYMPASDLADYDDNFFLEQVNVAFEAREYFGWGKSIPDDIFRHFVLVYRVNNEDLDNARRTFFEELKERVKGLTMKEAALEVNHWCHEKVTYRGTDGRTSAPLALVKTSWGRCGEESTFTTAALRAVGIPARQCYTPRWAHTDSNHAWVEVWVDGKWHYMGACEPEPELNVGWFTAPSKRAMMVHTNIFGSYNGPEEKTTETRLYSIVNLLENYTETRKVNVIVVDESGNPVKNATVNFNVYNYAQFYPVATINTEDNGKASISSGMGDLLIWANKGNKYGYVKSTVSDNHEITIALDREAGKNYDETFVIEVPREQEIATISKEKIEQNAIRLAYEDSIRNSYMNTFIKESEAKEFALNNNLAPDKVWNYLSKSQGNWKSISAFLSVKKGDNNLYPFLNSLTDKDLRDTPASYLEDHLIEGDNIYSIKSENSDYARYVLSPRIGVELIRPWRSFFKEQLTDDFISKSRDNIQFVINHIKDNITIDEIENYYRCPISPQGVYELKVADKRSRDIFFVALCRSMGIASRIDNVTQRPQYANLSDMEWIDVFFEEQAEEKPKGYVEFLNSDENIIKPAYSTHFTLARFDNGDFTTLNFRGIRNFPSKQAVDAGYYRLTIGSRANDGSITVNTRYFEVKEDETHSLKIELPEVEGRIQVQGIIDPNTIITLKDDSKKTIKELSNGKGLVICFADPDKEPTKHILQDLPAVKEFLDKWDGGVLFSIPDDKMSDAFSPSSFGGLPDNTVWNVDNQRKLLNDVAGALQIEFSNNFPLIIYLNTNGGILFSSQGYRIGIGENIVKTIEMEKNI